MPASIDTVKWFLMKQALKSMLVCFLFQYFHNQMVVIQSQVTGLIDRCQLMLCRSNLVMLCFCRNTQFPQFFINIFHKCSDTWTDASEIMVIHFLSFCRHGTK